MPEAIPSPAPSARINWLNLLFLVGTLLIAAIATPWYIATRGLGWPEALTFAGLWLAVGISVTGGYHRLFAHRTYQAAWPVRLLFVVFGAGALENSVVCWAADHRVHHSNVDHERDPYNIQKGFFWAHMGWILFKNEPPGPGVVRDLLEDPLLRWQARWYAPLGISVAFGIPLIVGLATGRVLGCLLIGGVLRVVASHHGTFFINSLCHMVGGQPYSREHSARDSSVMALLAFGEGYHNFHHSFPFDYRNGIRRWHFDPAKWTIYGLSLLGLARDLRRASDAVILKARIDVQFERAKERLERLRGRRRRRSISAEVRERVEQRLHEAYARLQEALRELVAVQRQRRPGLSAAGLQRAVEQARREWKQALRQMRQMKRRPVAAAAA